MLVTRLRFLGDVVMTTPMLETLRDALPDARIEYLTYEAYAPALDGNPNVDRVITMPPKAGVRDTLRVIRELRHPRIRLVLRHTQQSAQRYFDCSRCSASLGWARAESQGRFLLGRLHPRAINYQPSAGRWSPGTLAGFEY